jgi:Family of unknown function (DUF5678)
MSALNFELYAGRWIALVRGRVVASGESAHEAFLSCHAMRLKDEPVLRFIPVARAQRGRVEENQKTSHEPARKFTRVS